MRSSTFLHSRRHRPGGFPETPFFYRSVASKEFETAIDTANASGVFATPAKSKKITHFISSPDGDGGREKIEIPSKNRKKKKRK